MVEAKDTPLPPASGWRLKLGGALFALSIFGPPVLLPVVALMGLSVAMTATVSSAILVGAEVLIVAAVAVMGKPGYAYIKDRLFGFLRRYGPPKEVGRARYTIGIVMFAVPLFIGWLAPYAGAIIPGYHGNEITLAILGDLMLLVSLFVLGGDFWDKVRALFFHDTKTVSR